MNAQARIQYRVSITPAGEMRLQRRPRPLLVVVVVVAVAALASGGLWVTDRGPSALFFAIYGLVVVVAFGYPAVERHRQESGDGLLWADVRPVPETAAARAVLDVEAGRPEPTGRLGVARRWRRVPGPRVKDLHEAVQAEISDVIERDHAQEQAVHAAEDRTLRRRAAGED